MGIALAGRVLDSKQLGRRWWVLNAMSLNGGFDLLLHLVEENSLGLPEEVLGQSGARHKTMSQWLLFVGRVVMLEVLVAFRAIGDINCEITKLRSVPLEPDITLNLRVHRHRVCIHTQLAQALESGIEDHRDGLVGTSILTRNALHPETPAASVLASRDLDEVDREVQAISGIVDGLPAALSDIVFVPAIASHAFILLAGMSKIFMGGCQQQST